MGTVEGHVAGRTIGGACDDVGVRAGASSAAKANRGSGSHDGSRRGESGAGRRETSTR